MKILLTTAFIGFMFGLAVFAHKDHLYSNLFNETIPWVTGLKYSLQGQKELQAGHYPKALEAFDQAIASTPDFASTYTLRAITKFKLEDYTGALNDAEQAIQLDSTQALAYAYRDSIQLIEGITRFRLISNR